MYLIMRKKSLIKRLCICSILLLIGGICSFNLSERKNETIETSNKTNNKKIVIIDPGHGQPDRTEQLAQQE